MDKKCGNCKHWEATGSVSLDHMGVAGRCRKPVPVWVEYILGVRDMDRLMHEHQTAIECDTWEEEDNAG